MILDTAETSLDKVTATSCSRGDVLAAITAAANGDTVSIPACTCGSAVWTSHIDVAKCITIQGQGASSTCIQGYGFRFITGSDGFVLRNIKFQNTGGNIAVFDVGVQSGNAGTTVNGWRITNCECPRCVPHKCKFCRSC